MRLHLTLALITALLLVVTLRAHSRHRFNFARVQKDAEERAHTAYAPLPQVLPPQLRNLSPQQEAGINWKDRYRLWRKKGLPFQVDFYHISRTFPFGPAVNTVDAKGSHLLAYSPSFFNFSNLSLFPPLPNTLPYAGFYLRYPIPTALETKPNILNGFFSVLGGNYFRVLAANQVYGLSARAVAIDTAVDGRTEEFPQFTNWWLQEPAPDANQLVLDAVLDGPSLTGAYEFKIHPGNATSVDVHATLFFRRAVQRLGIAPFSSMYLYGENSGNHFGDNVHPEIHDSDGVLINNSKGEWLWRPLQQAPQLQLYNFTDENPKGFGLLQRDRNFQHYQDLDALYNVRPSAWVVPHGDWGKGAVQITQLPTNNTNTDNVVLFWRPDHEPQAGDRLDLDYTVTFYMNEALRPPLAVCSSTFINNPAPPPTPPVSISPGSPAGFVGPPAALARVKPPLAPGGTPSPSKPVDPGSITTPVQFLVDFQGNGLETIPASAPPDLELDCSPPGTVVRESKVEKNGYDNSWRVSFTIIPFKRHVPTELKCRLMAHATVKRLQDELAQLNDHLAQLLLVNDVNGSNDLRANALPQKEKALRDAEARPLTETWTYTWHQ